MSRRSKSASRQTIESIQENLVEYFHDHIIDGYDYEDLTGSELFEALVGTFRELESELQKKLNPLQFVLNKLDPEDSESQVLNG